jgi:hypothetical protein
MIHTHVFQYGTVIYTILAVIFLEQIPTQHECNEIVDAFTQDRSVCDMKISACLKGSKLKVSNFLLKRSSSTSHYKRTVTHN